jgi:hypothetical protein
MCCGTMPIHLTTVLNSYQIHFVLLTSDAAPGDLNTDVKEFKRSALSHALNLFMKPGPSTYSRPDAFSSHITLHSYSLCSHPLSLISLSPPPPAPPPPLSLCMHVLTQAHTH